MLDFDWHFEGEHGQALFALLQSDVSSHFASYLAAPTQAQTNRIVFRSHDTLLVL